MIDLQGFMLAMIPIALSPGASLTLAISNVSCNGTKGLLKVIIGTGLGILFHGVLVGLGVSKLIAESTVLLNVMQLAGIVFLLYLGIKLILSGFKIAVTGFDKFQDTSIKEAFLLIIFNVKALLFYLTVVPIFAGIDFFVYIFLASLHVLVMTVWTTVCAGLFSMARERISIIKVRLVINTVGGMCLVYLSYVSAISFGN